MARLTGKVALITGAAGGQGTAEAELFLREEAAVVLAEFDVAVGESLAQRLAGQGGGVVFLRQDVAEEASWREVVAATLARFGKLHILVNNAGTIARQGIADTTVEAWNRTIAVNLTGAMLGMKHCAPAIRDSGGGSIINISSTAGLTAHDDAAYTATKWGLRGSDQDRGAAVLGMEHPGQFDPSRTDRRHRFLPQRRRGLCPCCARCYSAAPAGHAKGMRRSGALPGVRRVELYQWCRDRHRRRLYRSRHGQPAQSRSRRFHRWPQLRANTRLGAQSSKTRRTPSSGARNDASSMVASDRSRLRFLCPHAPLDPRPHLLA